MRKLLSVVIVNWNGEKFIRKSLDSLMTVKYDNFEIVIIDNGSTDNSVKIIKENFSDKVTLIENENIGYAAGANKGINISKGEYILIANPDIVFTEDYLDKLVDKMEEDTYCAAVIGKLIKYDFDKESITKVIDSAGITLNHKRKAYDRGQNQIDNGQYDNDKRVFGVCGAAGLFKRSALNDIKIYDEYFDEDFFAYKEDVDLCWRLNLYGYKCFYVCNAVAYHGRGMNSSKGIIEVIKNRKNQSEFLKGISFRNQYLMLWKNEQISSYKRDRVKIIMEYFKYMIFFILFDRGCIKYKKQINEYKPRILKKREIISKNIRINDKEIYDLFNL